MNQKKVLTAATAFFLYLIAAVAALSTESVAATGGVDIVIWVCFTIVALVLAGVGYFNKDLIFLLAGAIALFIISFTAFANGVSTSIPVTPRLLTQGCLYNETTVGNWTNSTYNCGYTMNETTVLIKTWNDQYAGSFAEVMWLLAIYLLLVALYFIVIRYVGRQEPLPESMQDER